MSDKDKELALLVDKLKEQVGDLVRAMDQLEHDLKCTTKTKEPGSVSPWYGSPETGMIRVGLG